jgi:hypothetical protein
MLALSDCCPPCAYLSLLRLFAAARWTWSFLQIVADRDMDSAGLSFVKDPHAQFSSLPAADEAVSAKPAERADAVVAGG